MRHNDIIAIIRGRHGQIRGEARELAREIANGSPRWARAYRTLAKSLKHLTVIEEGVLYVVLENIPELHDVVVEAYGSLAIISQATKALAKQTKPPQGMVEELIAQIDLHFQYEEEQLFPNLAPHVDPVTLDKLGRQMREAYAVVGGKPRPVNRQRA
jgi:hypothetical protein